MSAEEDKFGLGVATFMGADLIKDVEETAEYDVAFLGVPIESGASYRHGQARAANNLRKYSAWDRIDDTEYVDLDRGSRHLSSSPQRIADLGDLVVDETDQVSTVSKVMQYTGRIAGNCLPVFIGGDHSVTYSTFQGAKSRVDRETKIGLIHFDAHFDVEDDYPNLPRVWHGNVFRALIDEGHITGKDLFTIGVRGIVPKKWVDYADAKEINYFTSDQLKQHKDDVIGKIATGLAAYDQVYVTMDVDSLDISQCPGTGTPRANGLMPGDIVDITRSCIIQPLLGVDIVEYSPLYDQNGQSAVTICEIMYDILAFRSRR